MIFSTFQGLKLSKLSLGCMRLPVIDGEDARVDKDKTQRMVSYAFEQGINYFDTAWGYHEGNSEKVIGEILNSFPRESYYLATKFPGYDLSNMPHVEEIFEEQLKRTQKDYFDFYLFHNVCEKNIDAYLDPQYGIYEYLLKQKEAGRIRHLGFSLHGDVDVLNRFLDAYGKDMEFCQIQLNWIDWEFQNAKEKVRILNDHNIPIWVMEPLRGGALCNLSAAETEALEKAAPRRNPIDWAFRFLQSIKGVTVILSGMSSPEQFEENVKYFSENHPLDEEEKNLLLKIAREKTKGIPCTACRYCTTHCPMQINIPKMISLYNEHVYSGGGFIAPFAVSAEKEGHRPSDCIGCRSCEKVCPQGIEISSVMADFTNRLEG